MPLLGKKLFDAGSPSGGTGDDAFCIPHTKEKFSSELEYKERLKLYERKIWTCQCTGHINLSHKEAYQSEKACRERLVCFGEVWEKPVLSLVQHSFSPLDNIVAQAHYLFMTSLVPGEKVIFSVSKPGKTFEATIVKCYEITDAHSNLSDQEIDHSLSASDKSISPSSDKENKSRQALITDVFKSDMRRSPRCSNFVARNDFINKGKKLKLLPGKYDILLTNENKIVSRVPCEHLSRLQKPPSRELIRLFIRANAVRLYGGKEKFPWVVDENMVFRHSLTSQISPEEEKRMTEASTVKSKEYIDELEHPQLNVYSKMNGHPVINGNATLVQDKNTSAHTNTSSNVAPVFSTLKRKNRSIDNKDKKRKKHNESTKKTHKHSNKQKRGMDLFVKKINKSKNAPSKSKMSPKKNTTSKSKLSEECVIIESDSSSSDQPLKASLHKLSNTSSPRQSGSSRKSTSPKKKKQATLLELTKKGGGVKLMGSPSPAKQRLTPSKPRKPRQPIIVLQLMSLKKEKEFRPHKYKRTITAACKILTEQQRNNAPALVKEDIMKKWELEEKKKKFKGMTEVEKRAYLAEQRNAKKKAKAASALAKFEDQHIKPIASKTLPDISLVSLPEGLPNTTFGDVAMLCEFFYCYHTLLCPKDAFFHKQFNIQSITTAVTSGKIGFGLTRKMLVVLLQTLLADNIAKDYSEVEYPLNQIAVTPEVSCELTRICLRQHDDEPDDVQSESSSNADFVDTGLSDSTSRRLFEMELYEMNPTEQVEILSALSYRVMNTYAVQAHMENITLKATSIWNKVVQQKKERKQKMKEERVEESPKKRGRPKTTKEELSEAKDQEIKKEADDAVDDIDLVSRVKKRKLLSELHRKEEQERKERWKAEQDKLLEEQRSRQERERANRQLVETRMQAVHARRRVPLGTDRNHSRYWLFCDGVPGFYMEKGWVGDHVDYCTNPDFEMDSLPSSPTKSPSKKSHNFDFSTPCSTTSSDEDDLPLSQFNSSKTKARFRKSKEESTWPRTGQNLWLSIDSQESLDKLMKSLLSNGIREAKLHNALQKNYDIILRSINKKKALLEASCEPVTRRSTLPADGEELHKTMAIKNFQSMIRETCRGGLASIEEPDIFEQRIATLENVSEFSALLLELFEAIPTKFLMKYMTGISDKKKKTVEAESDTTSDREKMKAQHRVAKWKQAVEETTLFSRFCLLLAILNNSIKWEMYHYSRQSTRRRATRNKNYADINEGIVEDEEEESEESEVEEDEGYRRSSRIREKKQTKPLLEEVLPERRRVRRPIKYEDEDSEDEESDEVESDSDCDVNSSSEENDDSEEENMKLSDSDDDVETESSICRSIIEKLLKYQYCEIFRDPVDQEDVPDYYDIVTQPICLNDILNKLDECEGSENSYTSETLMNDIRLLLNNAALYNSEESYAMKQAHKLESAFIRLCGSSFTEQGQRQCLHSLFDSAPR